MNRKLTPTEQAFWMGLAVAAVILVVVLSLVSLEHQRNAGDDDGGQTAKRVPVEMPPPEGGSGPAVPVPNVNLGNVDFSPLQGSLAFGVNGHSPLTPAPAPVTVPAEGE